LKRHVMQNLLCIELLKGGLIQTNDSPSSRRINKFGRIRFNESTKLLFTVDFSRPFRQFIHPFSSSFFTGIMNE
ncbi:hypothetical protein T06_4461, partial [Trichinella sp. T6]